MEEDKNHPPVSFKTHATYFTRFLYLLPANLVTFDSSRLTTAFFAISGLDVLKALDNLPANFREDICNWIYRLQVLPSEDGDMTRCGFQGSDTLKIKGEQGNEHCNSHYVMGHLAMTYTGLASLVILGDDLSRVNKKGIIAGVKALQQEDGSFCANFGSENDMRFVYCATTVCYILQDWSGMDVDKTVNFIKRCMSYDYGFGQSPELESHGGMTYCAVASLELMGKLHETLSKKQLEGLKRWSVFRQDSGFQGRANKPPDTCYSFWVGATLKILDLFGVVNFKENRKFLMTTQNPISGGFSKFEDTFPDPMHTYFGLCGLSLMGEEGLREVNPALNISKRATEHLHKLHEKWRKESQ